MQNITAIILELKRQYKAPGYIINSGLCEDFAIEVTKLLELSTNSIETTEDDNLHGHYWIIFKGKYYDAECSKGVINWGQLPIFKRYFKKNLS